MTDQDELRDRIGDLLENMDGFDFTDVAQTIIDLLGLTETDASRHNGMVKYETKWLPRSEE